VRSVLKSELEPVLANPAHIRNVPKRKSDVSDAMLIGDLLTHRLILSRRATALTVAGIWLVLLAFTPPVIPKGDGSSMFAVAESIVTQGSIT